MCVWWEGLHGLRANGILLNDFWAEWGLSLLIYLVLESHPESNISLSCTIEGWMGAGGKKQQYRQNLYTDPN